MTAAIACPRCETTLEVDPGTITRRVACGVCGYLFVPDSLRPRRRRRHRQPDGSGYAAASLVLGIGSAWIFCCWPLGAVASIAGLILGGMGLHSRNRKLAIAGLVLNCVGLTFAAGVAVVMIAATVAHQIDDPFLPNQDRPVLPRPDHAPVFPGPKPR